MIVLNDNQIFQRYKFRIFPTPEQAEYFDQCIIFNNQVYNWALSVENKQLELYKDGKVEYSFLSEYELSNMFTQYKKTNEYFNQFPLAIARGAIKRLVNAFKRYMNHSLPNNHPVYKDIYSNQNCSFVTRSDRFYINHDRIRINGLRRFETVYLGFDTGFTKEDTFYDSVVSRDYINQYWITVAKILDKPVLNIPKSEPIGIDINARVDSRIVLSNGFKFEEPPQLKKALMNVKSSQRELRKFRQIRTDYETNTGNSLPKSNNELHALEIYHKRYMRVQNITNTFYHTAIKQIIMSNPAGIVIEDLDVMKMLKRPYIADDVHHAAFGLFKQLMEYECNKYSIPLYKAPAEYQSSKICSNCGFVREDFKDQLNYTCPVCGLYIDRDINAAINLKQLYFGKLNEDDIV